MGVCDDILKKDISPSCDDPVVQGLEQEGVIMNRADVDFAATLFNSTRKNVIETLAMKTGKKAYKVIVPGKAPFTGTTTALATGTYRNSFTNTLVLVILANDPDVCADIIDGLANGSYVVVLENKYKGLQKKQIRAMPLFRFLDIIKVLQLLLLKTISIVKIQKADGP